VGLAVGLAADAAQAIEVSVVNYLWPTGTVLLAALLFRRRSFLLVLPGALVATTGIALAVGGESGLDLGRIASNVGANPLPYVLALTAAIAWSCYNVVSPRLSRGHDGITLFFTAVAVSLWVVHLVASAPVPDHVASLGYLAVIGAGAAVAVGYSLWNIGILHGDMRILATASYTTPVLSSAVAALMLGTALALPFWLGVALVVVGSLRSWYASRRAPAGSPSSLAGTIAPATVEAELDDDVVEG
jgi:drug/metabolite transporter (DMT)-like permease